MRVRVRSHTSDLTRQISRVRSSDLIYTPALRHIHVKIGNRATIPRLFSLSPSHCTDYANPAPNAMGNHSYLRFLDNAYQISLILHSFIRPRLVRCTAAFFHPQRSFSTCPCLQYPFMSVHGLSYSLILHPSIFICVQSGSPCSIPFDKPFPCIPLTRFPASAALYFRP
jgi:hypothetical protein